MNRRGLFLTLLLTLAGCASQDEPPEQAPVVVPAAIWERVDWDIINASAAAKAEASEQARVDMEIWRTRIYQQTDTTFIPWYSGYWTQQWLSAKVAWYNVSEGGESDPTVQRLAAYLEEQYQEQVLEPVAEQINPDAIRRQTTRLYVERLSHELQAIPQRHAVPQDQFDQRLQSIPAIAPQPPRNQQASVYQLIHARKLGKLPAYAQLNQQIESESAQAASQSSAGISGLARSASERLEAQIAARGAASTISAVVGKLASMILSVGATTYGVVSHQFAKPELEAQLRKAISEAFNEDWQVLMNDPKTGVLAEVNDLSEVIEGDRLKALSMPLAPEPVTPGLAAPEQPALHIETNDQPPLDYLDQFNHD